MNNATIDAIITFVDGADPLWQQDYENTLHKAPLTKRYRDWDTLPYLLRGIQNCMPFVRNIYLVVSRDSQVPAWCNRSNLRIILHEDIIPQAYLPTFNSTTIELFLSRIPGLSEKFLCFNDDFFPIAPCTEDVFFPEGKVATNFSRCLITRSYYQKHVRNSHRFASKLLSIKPGLTFLRPQHTVYPILKSVCEEVFEKAETEIQSSLAAVRTNNNFNLTLFLNYMLLSGRAIKRRIPSKFLSLATASPSKVYSIILSCGSKLVCINDVHLSPEQFEKYYEAIHSAFRQLFPDKSDYEL